MRGITALLDAVGKTILDVGHRLSKTDEAERPGKVLFVITTDGQENASQEFTYKKIQEMIKHQEETYNWEFLFMGANIDVAKEAENMGIQHDKAYRFEATSEGVETMYDFVCEEIMRIREE